MKTYKIAVIPGDGVGPEVLTEGMKVTGKIRNVVDFGAFVDIGEGKRGLVHISEVAREYVENLRNILKYIGVCDGNKFTVFNAPGCRIKLQIKLHRI